jgi:hypothetical protein
MSVLGIGVDLVENARIEHSVDIDHSIEGDPSLCDSIRPCGKCSLMENYKGNLEAMKP